MLVKEEKSRRGRVASFVCALALMSCALGGVSSAQDAGRRAARSLTSEDLLNRPVIYIPPPTTATAVAAAPSGVAKTAGATSYRDPAGAFTLSFPNRNWLVYKRAGSAGRIYNQRSFRRVEAEGFASATANIYVLTGNELAQMERARQSADGGREFAALLAARFLSNNASVVSIEPTSSNNRAGLRIIADQVIARRVAVRAAIHVFERQGRLFVVVCSASPESFDTHSGEFEVITNSLVSSVIRS
jgi:hypothetical protein